MKPRLKKVGGLWVCKIRFTDDIYGLGDTPAMAYADWVALRTKAAMEMQQDDWR